MKKTITLYIVLLVFAVSSVNAADFRKASWGDSMATVKKNASEKLSEQDNLLFNLYINIAGLSAGLRYVFEDGKLVSGLYMFFENHVTGDAYIYDYETLKQALIKKYGNPEVDQVQTKSEVWRDKEMQGVGLMTGEVVFISSWRLERTVISLLMGYENDRVYKKLYYHEINTWEKLYGEKKEPNTEGL